jgi:hypothetical protein
MTLFIAHFWYSAWLHFIVQYYTRTLVSTVTSSLPLLGSGFQRWTLTFLWVPELSSASAVSFQQQRLNHSSSLIVTQSQSQSQSDIATDGQSVSHMGFMTRYLLLFDSYGLVFVGALSGERTDLSFLHAAGLCQRSLSRVRVPWDSRPYFTVADFRISFSSLPTTHRATVEVFDPASTRV